MKQKEKVLSSLLVAIVAGFIYYSFADVETIKNIPRFAYKIFISPGTNESSVPALNAETIYSSVNDNLNNVQKNFTDADIISDEILLGDAVFGNPSSLAYIFNSESGIFQYINIPGFIPEKDRFIYRKQERIQKDKMDDFVVYSEYEFPEDKYIHHADFQDKFLSDSDRVRIHIRVNSLDSINIHIEKAMEKLNKSLNSLKEKLADGNFSVVVPDIKSEDFEYEFKFDTDKFKKDVQEFQNEMRELKHELKEMEGDVEIFKFDSEELEESMKELKDNLKDLQENIKDMKKNYREERRKIRIKSIES